MNQQKKARGKDILFLCMMIVPFLLAMTLKVITKPAADGISITGAMIYFEIPMPLQPLYITESQVNSAAVLIAILGLCLYLTNGLPAVPHS